MHSVNNYSFCHLGYALKERQTVTGFNECHGDCHKHPTQDKCLSLCFPAHYPVYFQQCSFVKNFTFYYIVSTQLGFSLSQLLGFPTFSKLAPYGFDEKALHYILFMCHKVLQQVKFYLIFSTIFYFPCAICLFTISLMIVLWQILAKL